MAITKTKLKKELLEKNFEDAERGNGRESDPRVLQYYNLKFDEKLEVIFIPDDEGNLFRHFKKHGPQLKLPGAGSIDCIYHSSKTTCPACTHGFDIMEHDKPMGKRWMAKDYYVAQCIVVNSPFEIEPLPDGNEARIVYLPYKVMKKIKEDYKEGLVEDPTEEIFVFKKTRGAGGGDDNASYENSFFRNQGIDQLRDELAECVIEPHDIYDGKIAPEPATVEEVEEWVAKAKELMAKKESSPKQGTSLKDQVGNRLNKSNTEDTASDVNEDTPKKASSRDEGEGAGSDQKEGEPRRLGLKERLRRREA